MGNISPYYFKTIFRQCIKHLPSFIKIGGAVSEKNGKTRQTFVVLDIGWTYFVKPILIFLAVLTYFLSHSRATPHTGKMSKLSPKKKFRHINSLVISIVKPLFSRNFCLKKNVHDAMSQCGNYRNFFSLFFCNIVEIFSWNQRCKYLI